MGGRYTRVVQAHAGYVAGMWTLLASLAAAADPTPTTFTPVRQFTAAEVQVAYNTACARTTDRTIVCWGEPFELHDGFPTWSLDGATDVVQHTLRSNEITTRHADGTVRSWTLGEWGEARVLPLTGVTHLTTTDSATCAVRNGGTVSCWGYAPWLSERDDQRDTPQPVPKLAGVTDLSCDDWGCVAHTPSGLLYAGRGNDLLPQSDRFKPIKLPGKPTDGLVLGYDRACWTGGRCFGRDNEDLPLALLHGADHVALGYDLGCATTAESTRCRSHRHAVDLPPMAQVSIDNHSACAVDPKGAVWCFGDNENGLLGDGSPVADPTPRKLVLDGVESLDAVHWGTCAVADGAWHCAGNGHSKPQRVGEAFGGVGGSQYHVVGTTAFGLRLIQSWAGEHEIERGGTPSGTATLAASDRTGNLFVATDTGLFVNYSLGEAGSAGSWKALGLPKGFGPVTGLASWAVGVCALSKTGAVACWQDRRFDGDPDFVDPPKLPQKLKPVDGMQGVVQIAAGQDAVCGRSGEGRVLCHGRLSHFGGNLGSEGQTVEVEGLRGATDLDLRNFHLCAVVDGGVRCVGSNGEGQLGRPPQNGEFGSGSSTPVSVTLPGRAVEVAVGQEHSCARLEDKTAWCWGSDEHGQLGRDRPLLLLDRAVRVKGSGPEPSQPEPG